jgi:RNA polymerase sigma-70 factor (ECF subfamily)
MAMTADEVVQVLLRQRLRIAAVAAAVVRDAHAADDIFQQVVLAALEYRDHFLEPEHVLPWAIRAARHRAIDLCRQRRVRTLPDEILDLLEAQASEPAGGWSERAEALHHCLGQLGGPARDLLRMKYTDGLTAVAIAGRLRRTRDAVYQSLSRIHRSLRECVERELLRLENPAREGVS